ncbi:MAG: cyclase [Myxococcales bacterium]|nr:cyclase [Myxococcales bacterium]
MVILILKHEISDFERWKALFDAGADMRKQNGMSVQTVARVSGQPNMIVIISQVPSVEQAKAFLANPQLRAAMAEAGVKGAPEMTFLEPLA